MVKGLHWCAPQLLTQDLSGKVILITGGYGGIGGEAARQLVSQKATVVMAGRSKTKGTTVASQMGGIYMELDLCDMASVKTFAANFSQKYAKLDVLVNNAAVCGPFPDGATHTKDGLERCMATNYLGHFLLTHLLLDLLKATAGSRIVTVSSCAAECMPAVGQKNMADVDLADPHWKTRVYNDLDAYGQSKLAQLLHAQELATKVDNIKVVALHPGWGNSDLFRGAPFFVRKVVLGCFGRRMGLLTLEEASQVHLHCILADDIVNGKFYSQLGIYGNPDMQKGGLPMEFINPNATVEKQKSLWVWSMNVLGIKWT